MKVYDGTQTESGQDPSPERIKVGIAEYKVTTDTAVLTTSGLGSCIGIAIYDERSDAAGLVHIMLPTAEEMADGNRAKFADTGVETLDEFGIPIVGEDVGGDHGRSLRLEADSGDLIVKSANTESTVL